MTAKLIKGTEIREKILAEIKEEVEKIKKERGAVPGLVTILVGENPASISYVTGKIKTAKELGFKEVQDNQPESISEKELLDLIEKYNKDDTIHGILVQLPLPKHINEKRVLNAAEKVAKEDTCVLVMGETGTGKEILARAIHNMSPRKGHSMIRVNCAALPATLIESELFGREKGAFTGAASKQVGRFEAANRSTIFLDEIGDLPMELQGKLLRVLQDNTFERLGSSETISVDVRVIAATNHNLAELVRDNKFRRDLYYRLNVFPITVPPLRERREDIPLMVWTFVEELSQSMGKSIKTIPKRAMDQLLGYYWPGNVRELKNLIERAMIMSNGTTLHIEKLEAEEITAGQDMRLVDMERNHINQVLESTGWRVSGKKGAARLLDLKVSTLRSRMKKLGIERP